MLPIRLRSALSLVCLLAPSLAAQSSPQAEEPAGPKTHDTIVVTATRSERELGGLPVSTTVIAGTDVESAPAATADELLRNVAGVHVPLASSSQTINIQQTFSMRGLGGTRALVLVDGIPLHDSYDGGITWQKVPLESVRQVEITRGGSASLFGNYALGGTVHLRTQGVEETGVALDASYGSFDTMRTSFSAGHVLSESLSAGISHHRSDSNGYVRIPNPGPVDVAAWSDTSVTNVRTDYALSPRTRGFLKAGLSEFRMSSGNEPSASDRDFVDLAARADHSLGGRALLSAALFHSDGDERWNTVTVVGPLRDSSFLSSDAVMPSRSTGGSFDWSLERDGALAFVSAGVDYRQVRAGERRDTFDRTGAVTRTNLVNGRQSFAALFAQASWRPRPEVEVLASARLDRFRNYDGSDDIVNGAASNYPDVSRTELNPRLSVRWAAGPRLALRTAAYRAFRAATLRDLYRNSQVGTVVVWANPNLQPETLRGAEVGLEWMLASSTRLEVNAYRNEVDGFHIRAGVPGQPANVVQLQNAGAVEAQGVEAMLTTRLTRRFSLEAGYTWADSVITEAPAANLVGKLVPDVVPHIGSLGVRYRGDDGLKVDLRGRVMSRSYGEPANVTAAPAHRIVDVAVSRPVRPWLEVYALAENALDEEYFWLLLTPTNRRVGAPRTITGGVRFRWPGRNGA